MNLTIVIAPYANAYLEKLFVRLLSIRVSIAVRNAEWYTLQTLHLSITLPILSIPAIRHMTISLSIIGRSFLIFFPAEYLCGAKCLMLDALRAV